MAECIHNARSRYTHGFYCRDCDTFFDNNSDVYRSSELLSSIWMVLHNINVNSRRSGNGDITEIIKMRDKIGVGKTHSNYDDLIAEAEILMGNHGKNAESASLTLGE